MTRFIFALALIATCLIFPSTVLAQSAPLAHYRVETTDLLGNPITTIERDQPFLLQAFVLDLRASGNQGVVAGWIDVTYQPTLASVTGPIDHGSDYTVGTSGTSETGSLEEVGGIYNALMAPGPMERLLFRVPFQSGLQLGTILFASDPSDITPTHDTLLFVEVISSEEILYLSTELTVVPEPSTLAMGASAGFILIACWATRRQRAMRPLRMRQR